jgi:hypothetical protein
MPGAFLCNQHQRLPVVEPKPVGRSITVDRDTLMGWKVEGLIPMRGYIYLALQIDGLTTQVRPLKMVEFCARWSVTEADVITAIANLSRKGLVKMRVKVEAQAVSHDERLKEMERAYAGT